MLVRVIKSFKDKNDNSVVYPVDVLIDFFDEKRCQDLIKRELVVEEGLKDTKADDKTKDDKANDKTKDDKANESKNEK